MHVLLFPSEGIGLSTSYVSRNMSYYNLYSWESGIRMQWYAVAFCQLKLKFSIAAKERLKQLATSKNWYHYLYWRRCVFEIWVDGGTDKLSCKHETIPVATTRKWNMVQTSKCSCAESNDLIWRSTFEFDEFDLSRSSYWIRPAHAVASKRLKYDSDSVVELLMRRMHLIHGFVFPINKPALLRYKFSNSLGLTQRGIWFSA